MAGSRGHAMQTIDPPIYLRLVRRYGGRWPRKALRPTGVPGPSTGRILQVADATRNARDW